MGFNKKQLTSNGGLENHLKPNFFFSLSLFLTTSKHRSLQVLFRSFTGRLPIYFPVVIVRHSCDKINVTSSLNHTLTIHFPHSLHEVMWVLETNKAIAFCLFCVFVPDYFGFKK